MIEITKVYDHGCPICEQMSQYDEKIAADLNTKLTAVVLEDVLDAEGDKVFYMALGQYLERYAVNPDYTLDLPVYMVTHNKKYLGHTIGEQSQYDLKSKLENICEKQNL